MDREKVINYAEETLTNVLPDEKDTSGIMVKVGWIREVLYLLKEQEEKLKFLDALYNYINPNDMEKYMQMYKSLPISSDGRSVK